MAAVTITVRENGPYRITGPFQLVDADGNAYALPAGETVALCRCGRSATKPFCDKIAPRGLGFDATERAAR